MNEPEQNPYQPPKALVADVAPGEDKTPIPMLANIGVGLLWINFTLNLIGGAIQLPGVLERSRQFGTAMAVSLIGVVVVLTLLLACVIHFISRRRHWARILYLAIFLIGLPFFLLAIGQTFASSFATGIGAVLKTMVQAAALMLLFLPSSNAWFRARHKG
jgi:hypothetical protein